MKKIISFYNQNRHLVWVIIFSIIAVITLIQVLDKLAYEKNNTSNNNTTISNYSNNINYNYSVITGQEVKTDISEIVKSFIEKCNNGQVQDAYNMLSIECKEELYPNIEEFTQKYYNRIFDEKKSYIHQSWITDENKYTYRIDFVPDMLATGSPSKTSIVDYYTVVKNNNDYKLNINKFIGKEVINKTGINEDIIIYVQEKKMYMDYEVYTIEAVNNTQKTLKLDDMKKTDNIYVEDKNEHKYYWHNNEIIENDITVRSRRSQKIEVKFNKEYSIKTKPVKMVFENVIVGNKIINISIEM